MNVVFIGDVAGRAGRETLSRGLAAIKRDYSADLTIVNGENSADGNGIDRSSANAIYDAGADVITTGNHAFHHKSIIEEYERGERLVRPANYGDGVYGRGFCVWDLGHCRAAIVNLQGRTFMQPTDNPFKCADEVLKSLDTKTIIVDFHAEATSEKRAMGYYLSGRVSAVIGTHTHVQTADEQIIDGTGYITDVGMTGASCSILGMSKDDIIARFADYTPHKQSFAEGKGEINGVFLQIDEKSGNCLKIERFRRYDGE